MNAIPLAPTKRYFFRFNSKDLTAAGRDLTVLLQPLLASTHSDGAFVYRAAEEADEFRAVAASTTDAPRIPELGVTLGSEATSLLSRAKEPVQTSHLSEQVFANLPETLQFGIRSAVIFPLRTTDAVLGFLTLGRSHPEAFDDAAIRTALPVARIAEAVLERDTLQNALRERKLIERAKGIIQSRRSRRTMSAVAGDIICERRSPQDRLTVLP
jgi:transcriptional regulator with GAF, ATPase, and Fis domain